MGYTHYVELPKNMTTEKFNAFIKDVKAILSQDNENILANGMGEVGTKPTITKKLVSFNGVGVDSHETCYIPFISGGTGLEFCKTARKKYDKYVTATYIALKYHFPTAKISSDGGVDGFEKGLKLFCEICRDFKMPKLD